ncbi:penicillin-binding protein 2 [Acaryochloris sp. IP29b_bin.137]|uniref:peptidoglycan D,D-transpeptidase FtsI family protein n=1 Tax=Acaryochloris sp. IP29b_bin.137 TaxID=2969217 RepID=UPI00261E459C|nr:penicillin-binding protein 2 [Acaryochloris sp. IP29b_bin.137]
MPTPSPPLQDRRATIKARIQQKQPHRVQNQRLRLFLVWLLLLGGILGLSARLIYLQVGAAPYFQKKARNQQLETLPERMYRYPIVDSQGNLLAKDEPVFRLYAHPIQFKSDQNSDHQIAQALAPVVDQTEADLIKLLQSGESGIPIGYRISEKKAEQIKKLRINDRPIDGLEITQEWQRIYPQSELTAGLVGYVNVENKGQSGIEYSQQTLLRGAPPPLLATRDGQGDWLPDQFPLEPLNANDLTLRLTLDTRLQRSARQALHKAMAKFRAKRGTVIVMDVEDGSLKALASEPSFNPQRYFEANQALFKNWAVSDLYEPGSTFKPINVAIALESNAIKADSVFHDGGQITVGGWPINNADNSGHGNLSVTGILEYSSNVGMVHIMQRMERLAYYNFLKKIGIGQMTGTDLPFETPGQFKNKQQFLDYPIEAATAAFGQGFSVTPLQMAQLHAAIANGGKLVTPHVVDGLYNPLGKKTKGLNLIQPRQIFSEDTAAQVQTMMGSVVQNGTGKSARIPGYRLGGKTGTAQKANRGTYTNARITSFVASFPLESPKYVVLAVVDEPQGGNAYGSTVAAPVVKSVLETLISVEGIPPTHPAELKAKSKGARSGG